MPLTRNWGKNITFSVPFRATPSFLTVVTSLRTLRSPIITGSTFQEVILITIFQIIHLFVTSPLEDTVRRLHAEIRCLQKEMGDVETCHIGGGQGGIGDHALPKKTTLVQINFSRSHLVELISAGVASLRAGTLSTKLSNPEQRLASTEAAAATTCGKNCYNTSARESIIEF